MTLNHLGLSYKAVIKMTQGHFNQLNTDYLIFSHIAFIHFIFISRDPNII
jgi:hypothetical protein